MNRIMFLRSSRRVWAFVACLLVGASAWAAPISLNVKITPVDPMLPERASTTDVLKQGFTAQLCWGDSPQLPTNVTDVTYGKWTVTGATHRPPHGRQRQEQAQGIFENAGGPINTLTSLVFNKAGHWTVSITVNAGYKKDGEQEVLVSTPCTVEIDIVEQPLRVTVNGTEDKFGTSKETDDFVPVGVQGFPRPYVVAEIKLSREGFPPGRMGPQDVEVKVSAGGVLRDESANADWATSTIQLTPGGPAKKFKLFGVKASAGWDGDHIEAKLVNPPEALRDVSPVKEDFTAFELRRGVVVGTRREFNPDTGDAGTNNVNVDPEVPDNHREESPRVVMRKVDGISPKSPLATIRLGAVLSPEVPVQGTPVGGISHETLVKAIGNRFVWTLEGSNGYLQDGDYKGYGRTIGAPLKKWQTAGLDWRIPHSRDGGPRVEIIARAGKREMPVDNKGLGEMAASKPTCELRWPTTLGDSNVKVAEVKGQVPQLFFQRLRNDHPGDVSNVADTKKKAANWFYYWAADQGGPCLYSAKKIQYEQPIIFKTSRNAYGIFRGGKISISDRNVTAPSDWSFPRDPAKAPANCVHASWNEIHGPHFVNLTFAHESTHETLSKNDPKAEDHDRVPTKWEEAVAGMSPTEGDSFKEQFSVSATSDALRDEEFYCTLGGAVGASAINQGRVEQNPALVYHGTPYKAAAGDRDWSVNGQHWQSQ